MLIGIKYLKLQKEIINLCVIIIKVRLTDMKKDIIMLIIKVMNSKQMK